MSSTRGPLPKRMKERAGHQSKASAADSVTESAVVVRPVLPDRETLHPLAVALFDSLAESGQARWYEPSDWQHAIVATTLLSEQLGATRKSAEIIKACFAEFAKLGVTESDRRRMRIEVERPAGDTDAEEAAGEGILARFADLAGNA